MKKTFVLILAFTIHSLITTAQTLRLATYQYADNDRIKNIEPLANHLQIKLGCAVSVRSYPTVHTFIEAIQKGEVDIALINTFGFLLLDAADTKYPMKPLLTLEISADAKDNYKTAFVVPAQSGIRSLEELKTSTSRGRLMLVAEGSTSGNLVPRLALSGIGLANAEKHFVSVQYAKTHINALNTVLDQTADIAAMGNAEYDKLLQKDPMAKDKIRRIWLSPEIPLGPVLVNNGMNKILQEKITDALLKLHTDNTGAFESVKNGWTEARQATHYISITGNFYTPFKKVLGSEQDLQRIIKQFE